MKYLREKSLRFRLPRAATGRRLDDSAGHGLSHCMKAVDFIVDLPVLNIKTWNEHFPDFRISRLPADTKPPSSP